jgi:hypothetical protein
MLFDPFLADAILESQPRYVQVGHALILAQPGLTGGRTGASGPVDPFCGSAIAPVRAIGDRSARLSAKVVETLALSRPSSIVRFAAR